MKTNAYKCPTRVGSDLGSGRVGSGRVTKMILDLGSGRVTASSGRVGSGQKILTDFEFYISQIAGLDEIMVLLL